MSVRFKRSYRDRKQAVAKRKKFVIKIFIVIFVFQIIFTFFFSTIKIGSVSMEPGLDNGSMMVYTPLTYGYQFELINSRLPEIRSPERGDLIVFSPPYNAPKKGIIPKISSVIKFLSFNKIDLDTIGAEDWENPFLLKRVIAIPGDIIKMEKFTVYVKPEKEDYFLNEFEIINSEYNLNIGTLPEGWSDSIPFSGNMEKITLKENEYFVLGDNRMESNDSLNWGVLKRNKIIGRVIMQYWPLSNISFF